jgi:hypothetical protein
MSPFALRSPPASTILLRISDTKKNWAVLKLPALIDKIQVLESDQTVDLRGSLHGQGSFELAAQSKKLFVSHETWTHLT